MTVTAGGLAGSSSLKDKHGTGQKGARCWGQLAEAAGSAFRVTGLVHFRASEGKFLVDKKRKMT